MSYFPIIIVSIAASILYTSLEETTLHHFIYEKLESVYHYPDDKISLALKYAKSKEETVELYDNNTIINQ